MKMARVYITTSDPVLYVVYDEQESREMFGDDLEEFGTDIPDRLLMKYKKVVQELEDIQKQLRQYKK